MLVIALWPCSHWFFLKSVSVRETASHKAEKTSREAARRERLVFTPSHLWDQDISLCTLCVRLLFSYFAHDKCFYEWGDRPTQILKKLIQWKELYHALGLEPYGSWLGQPFRLKGHDLVRGFLSGFSGFSVCIIWSLSNYWKFWKQKWKLTCKIGCWIWPAKDERAVRAPLWLLIGFVHGNANFRFSTSLENRQLLCLRLVGIFNIAMLILFIFCVIWSAPLTCAR